MSGLPGLESGFLGSDKAHGGAPGGRGGVDWGRREGGGS